MNIIKVLAFAILAQSVAACKSDDASSDDASSGALVPGVSVNANLQVITSQSQE